MRRGLVHGPPDPGHTRGDGAWGFRTAPRVPVGTGTPVLVHRRRTIRSTRTTGAAVPVHVRIAANGAPHMGMGMYVRLRDPSIVRGAQPRRVNGACVLEEQQASLRLSQRFKELLALTMNDRGLRHSGDRLTSPALGRLSSGLSACWCRWVRTDGALRRGAACAVPSAGRLCAAATRMTSTRGQVRRSRSDRAGSPLPDRRRIVADPRRAANARDSV